MKSFPFSVCCSGRRKRIQAFFFFHLFLFDFILFLFNFGNFIFLERISSLSNSASLSHQTDFWFRNWIYTGVVIPKSSTMCAANYVAKTSVNLTVRFRHIRFRFKYKHFFTLITFTDLSRSVFMHVDAGGLMFSLSSICADVRNV